MNILVIGKEHNDRLAYAINLAEKLLCENSTTTAGCQLCRNCQRVKNRNHPNVIFIEPVAANGNKASGTESNASIKIDQIRPIVVESQKANFEAGLGIFIITHMHKATTSAANALLKIIEESKHDQMIMALAPSRMSVLPTIASRLVCHTITPAMTSSSPINPVVSAQLIEISAIPPHQRFSYCEQFSTERDELLLMLDDMSEACHAMLHQEIISPLLALKLKEAIFKAHSDLQRNLNSRLVIEQLVLREWPHVK